MAKEKNNIENQNPDYLSNQGNPHQQDIEKQIPPEVQKEIEKTREKLQDFKKHITKKFPFIESMGILPPWGSQLLEEDEEVIREKDEKLIYVIIVLPDENAKDINAVKAEAINLIKDFKPRIWLSIRTKSAIWEASLDGKYNLVDAFALSFPLHDKEGFLSYLRLATIHKRMCLAKFERYIVSYVIAGSLVRGNSKKTSDVDVYLVIDDTDVKRMSRFELKERLRSIIWNYAIEAGEESGVKNKLNVQIYILTEFWEAVKDAHPVMFTFIRDGVPLYDRGAFTPWKLLLKMGKIKPSPEAIDLFMSLGEKVSENVKMKLNNIVMEDIWWGVITPSQAVLMLYGLAPPTHKETPGLMREYLVKKEKILEEKYVKILENIVDMYRKYEHDFKLTVTGKQIDQLLEDVSVYMARLKEVMKEIEERTAEKDIKQQYDQISDLISHLVGKVSPTNIREKFKKELIDKKRITSRNYLLLQDILEIIKKNKQKKANKHDLAKMRKDIHELSADLLEYIQKKELLENQKNKADIVYTATENNKQIKKHGQIYIFNDIAFVIPDINTDEIKKIQGKQIINSTPEELKTYLGKKADKKLTHELLSTLKKMFNDFEIIF